MGTEGPHSHVGSVDKVSLSTAAGQNGGVATAKTEQDTAALQAPRPIGRLPKHHTHSFKAVHDSQESKVVASHRVPVTATTVCGCSTTKASVNTTSAVTDGNISVEDICNDCKKQTQQQKKTPPTTYQPTYTHKKKNAFDSDNHPASTLVVIARPKASVHTKNRK